MRLTRLYLPDIEFSAGRSVALYPEQAHYLLRVLRMESGQDIVLFNAQSGAWIGALEIIGKKAAVTLREQIQKPQAPKDVWLLASPLKKEEWLFVIEKATELGVATIQPVLLEYTQTPRVNAERDKANLIEASQQCERTHVPDYFGLEKLDKVLSNWNPERLLFVAMERSDAAKAIDVFKEKHDKAAILIGPEGGFSLRERELLLAKPYVRALSLGNTILRAETAAVAALAVYAQA